MEGKVEAIFDTTFIVQSHAESVSKIVGAIFEGRNRYTQYERASPRSLMPPLVIGPSLLFHLMNSNTYMGWKNFSMSVPALKTAPMILLKLFAWNDIINGMSKWLHLWPPIFLAYFWLSRLCEQSNSHTSKVDMFFSNYIVIVVRKFSPNIKMHQKTKRVFVQLPMHTCVIIHT